MLVITANTLRQQLTNTEGKEMCYLPVTEEGFNLTPDLHCMQLCSGPLRHTVAVIRFHPQFTLHLLQCSAQRRYEKYAQEI